MPKVGNKTFPYTDKGEGQAEVYAAQTGQPISREEKDSFGYGTYQEGGGAEQSPEFMVMDVILKGLSSKIANSLDNTEQPLTMAKDLLRFTEGDANKAAEMAAQINYEFSSTAPENSSVGDYWDYWTRKLPEIYKPNEMQRGGPVKRYGYQTGGVTGRGLDYSETLNDEKQMFRDKKGNYTVNLAKQYETPEGLRYYEGTGQSPDMFFAESMAETDARRVLSDNPADSLVTGGKRPYAKDGLIRSILGKFGF